MVVVFPAPLGPRSEKTSPSFTAKEIPSTACNVPYAFFSEVTSIATSVNLLPLRLLHLEVLSQVKASTLVGSLAGKLGLCALIAILA
jgi:hypothetical protein